MRNWLIWAGVIAFILFCTFFVSCGDNLPWA